MLSSITEEFGLVAVESLLLGTPVVASRVGGEPEVIVEGQNGLLVEPKVSTDWRYSVDAGESGAGPAHGVERPRYGTDEVQP